MRSYHLKAIIVKRRNFMEKDRILTFFSLENGKIEALAKGARRPGNRLSANSDLATCARFHIHKTKSIDIISEIEPFFNPDPIRGQFDETQKLSYALKIIDKLFDFEEPHPKTYNSLFYLIKSISRGKSQLIFMKFILDVLRDLGSLPNLNSCPFCHKPITSSDEFTFGFTGGLTHKHCLEGDCIQINSNQVKLLRIISNSNIEKVENLKVDQDIFNQSYLIILKYFSYEFGKILPDEVM